MAFVKKFSWSWSSLDTWETCPRMYEWKYVLKNWGPETEAQKWGNTVHSALEGRCVFNEPLPEALTSLEKYGQIADSARAAGLLVIGEQDWAIDRNFKPCGSREWDVVYCRLKVDLGIIAPKRAIFIDWKTGKPKEGSDQLALGAAIGFIQYPHLEEIETKFIWTINGQQTPSVYKRENSHNFWASFLPRVNAMEKAWTLKQFPPTPNYLCRAHCDVKTCEHNGKAFRR